MYLWVSLLISLLAGANFTAAQETSGRLSVASMTNTNPASATSQASPPNSPPQASPTAPSTPVSTSTNTPFVSNVTDAPLPEVANQPKVITSTQTSGPESPKGPRDGRWYVAGGAGAMLQQTISQGTATSVGNPPLDQTDSGNLGFYAEGKVGYDFAIRDVQLAFGNPTPMRTAMELEFNYLGSYEKIPLENGSVAAGTETYNLSAYSVMLNGLIKFEDLPITPYFGGGVGAAVLYSNDHKITNTAGEDVTTVSSANNVCLALQAIVGIERNIYENLSFYVEYKFLAYMDVQFAYGDESSVNQPGGSNSSNNFMAQQIVASGLKWGF
jgi:opacity protein-like surface antigen